MSTSVLQQVLNLLDSHDIEYRKIDHEPTLTSEDSARARIEPLEVGAKALLLKSDSDYLITVIPAHRKLDSAAVKRLTDSKKLRFATEEELLELTGLVPGSLPPFGQPIFPFPLYADLSVGKDFGRIAFNAGSRTTSLVMQLDAWQEVAKPCLSLICQAG